MCTYGCSYFHSLLNLVPVNTADRRVARGCVLPGVHKGTTVHGTKFSTAVYTAVDLGPAIRYRTRMCVTLEYSTHCVCVYTHKTGTYIRTCVRVYSKFKTGVFGQSDLFDPKLTRHFLQYARRRACELYQGAPSSSF